MINDKDYCGFNDLKFVNIDDYFEMPYKKPGFRDHRQTCKENIEYIKHVLDKYPNIIDKNTRTFIPGHIKRTSHDAIRDFIQTEYPSAVVIVLNGIEKSLQYFNNGELCTIDLMKNTDQEVCEVIAENIFSNELEERPIIITGFLCVGMGQTLTHKDLGSFTSAIISHMDISNDDIYQLFGRITGRMKEWTTYARTTVYAPTDIINRCRIMEECSSQMASEFNGKIVTQDDYRKPIFTDVMGESTKNNLPMAKVPRKINTDKEIRVFNSQEDAIYFVKHTLHHQINKRPRDQLAPKT